MPREHGPEGVPPTYREMLAVHEAFRRLGVGPDRIFVCVMPDGCGAVVLPDVGDITVPCGPVDPAVFQTAWGAAVDWWNTTTDRNRMAVWEGSIVRMKSATFVALLAAAGFPMPTPEVRDGG